MDSHHVSFRSPSDAECHHRQTRIKSLRPQVRCAICTALDPIIDTTVQTCAGSVVQIALCKTCIDSMQYIARCEQEKAKNGYC